MTSSLIVATMMSAKGTVGAEPVCSPIVGCVPAGLLTQALMWVGLAALTVFALAALAFIPDARAVLRDERERAGDERDAFARFARRVTDIDATAGQGYAAGGNGANQGVPGSGPGPGTLALAGGGGKPPDDHVAQARRAYRETVMSVSHYEEEYGESLAENVSAEFGESVAIALEGADAFTPGLRQTLLDGAETARDRRNSLVRAIEKEEATLREAAKSLSDVESDVESIEGGSTLSLSFEQLMDRWGHLYDLEQECEAILEERQETLRSGYGVPLRLDGPISLQEYLYDSLPVTHPVLAETTRLLEVVRGVQDSTSVALSRRV